MTACSLVSDEYSPNSNLYGKDVQEFWLTSVTKQTKDLDTFLLRL